MISRLLIVLSALMLLAPACGWFMPGEGHLGQSCTTGGVCVDGSICEDGLCVKPVHNDGDLDDNELNNEDNENDSGPEDGDMETADTSDNDNSTVDGDEESSKEDDDSCAPVSHYTYNCVSGDVFWFDSCGSREEMKEQCDDCACNGGVCEVNSQYYSDCYDNDVYWFDCHNVHQEKKEECRGNGCKDGTCKPATFTCANQVCTDSPTGLQWQQEPGYTPRQWDAANTYCNDLTFDGGGWRMPNISELRTIVRNCDSIESGGACPVNDICEVCEIDAEDVCLGSSCKAESDCKPESCTDDGGPTSCYWVEGLATTCDTYWSSSEYASLDGYYWVVRFKTGEITDISNQSYILVRCVR